MNGTSPVAHKAVAHKAVTYKAVTRKAVTHKAVAQDCNPSKMLPAAHIE